MEQRTVAFIDILGFRELLRQMSAGNRDLVEAIPRSLQALRAFGRVAEEMGPPYRFPTWQATAFSDCIVLSDECSDLGVARIVSYAAIVASMLLEAGILSRGGIVLGPLFHDGGVVFGEGLVRAYELEQSTAVYPRIVVSDEVAAKFARPFFERLAKDIDGCWYVDVLWSLQVASGTSRVGLAGLYQERRADSERFALVRTAIATGIDREFSSAEPRLSVLAKYRWLAHRFNAAVRELKPEGIEALEVG